jgi:hypothetical protein
MKIAEAQRSGTGSLDSGQAVAEVHFNLRDVHEKGEYTMQNEAREKKAYTAPELVAHGTVEEITADQNKGYGLSDGFLFMGNPIKNIS